MIVDKVLIVLLSIHIFLAFASCCVNCYRRGKRDASRRRYVTIFTRKDGCCIGAVSDHDVFVIWRHAEKFEDILRNSQACIKPDCGEEEGGAR